MCTICNFDEASTFFFDKCMHINQQNQRDQRPANKGGKEEHQEKLQLKAQVVQVNLQHCSHEAT